MTEVKDLVAPPASAESEQAIIAAIVQHGKTEQAVRECIDLLKPEMFFYARNREIFDICVRLPNIDFILLTEELKEKAKRERYQFDLSEIVAYKRAYSSLQMLKTHTENLIERYTQRQLATIAYEVSEKALSKEKPSEIINYLQSQLADIDMPSTYEARHISDCLKDHINVLQERANGNDRVIGIETGIKDLDKQILGIAETWLVTLAGRPSHGKSLVSQLISNHISRSKPTQFFSLEMEETELMDRYICLLTGASIDEVRTGMLEPETYEKLARLMTQAKNKEVNQWIDTTPNLSLQQIITRAKQTKKKYPELGLILVDYLGLIKREKSERNDLAIADITRGLKGLAKEIKTPVMLLVQCNRSADKAERLNMSHLADAASIERDSDLILFTHKEEVSNPDTDAKGIIELTCGKFRHGTFKHDIYLKKVGGFYECVNYQPQKKYSSRGFDL